MTLKGMTDAIVYLLKRERDRELIERKSMGGIYVDTDIERILHDFDLMIDYVEKKDIPVAKDTPVPPVELQGRIRVFKDINDGLHLEHTATCEFPIRTDIRVGDIRLVIGVDMVCAKSRGESESRPVVDKQKLLDWVGIHADTADPRGFVVSVNDLQDAIRRGEFKC